MPVEIKELIVRAIAVPQATETQAPRQREEEREAERVALVEACVKQVLRILKAKKEA